jgi:protein-S-isoprenylcysteine O-methyltransferase Ste14
MTSAKAIWRRVSGKENAIFGGLICVSAGYDWLALYKGVNLIGPYYAHGVYVLSSLSLFSILLFASYSTLGGIILLNAHQARSRYKSVTPNVVAIAAVFAPYLFAFLSKGDLLAVSAYVAYFFVISGSLITLVSLLYLRRALTITPQATTLVTTGPYALVRHPMYSGSILILFGLMLLIDSGAAVGLFVVCAGLQIVRARYEEALLGENFSAYGPYRSRVGGFVPFRSHRVAIGTE